MHRPLRVVFAASVAALALVATACTGGGSAGGGGDGAATQHPAPATGDGATTGDGTAHDATDPAAPTGPAVPREPASITWWHNGTGEPLNSFWQQIADEFHAAHPNVTVHVQAFQNEELRHTLLPDAFTGGNAPDLFQSWGGGELVQWVNEGRVRDLSQTNAAAIADLGTVVTPWQVAGRTYGLPYRFGPSGFWYNEDVFARAGIDPATFEAPDTLDELYELWDQLRAAGETPVALGGATGWPAAHWYYWAAVKSCPPNTLQLAVTDHDFSDPCWVQAAEVLRQIAGHNPFHSGWHDAVAQGGADSSSGLVITGQAAMELTGDWAPTVMADIEAHETGTVAMGLPENIGWFPFPAIPGASGDQTAILGGGDGFSISADAPAATEALLDYILSPDVQRRYAALGYLPTRSGADSAITYAPLRANFDALHRAGHVQLWLDVALGQQFSNINGTVVGFLTNPHDDPHVIVDQLKSIAGQQ